MKKIIISIICLLSIFGTTNAFFGSPTSLDLYKNIDEGIIKLQDKMIQYELEGGVEKKGILIGINNLAEKENIDICLDESKTISKSEFDKIIKEQSINTINNYIHLDCKNNNNTSIKILTDYLDLFNLYGEISNFTGNKKTKQIYKLSNIGLYADGNIENSGFDLIKDIEDIDKIIFASVTDYEGDSDSSINDDLNNLLGSTINKLERLDDPNKINNTADIKNIIYKPNINILNNNDSVINSYICSEDLNNSGLSEESQNFIINNISSPVIINNTDELLIENKGAIAPKDLTTLSLNSNYNKIRDNSEWPCEQFFCINIDFIMYEHNLFGGGKNITIEYLLNRSNKHLRKYSATSLAQAEMTVGNFEGIFKDLNLADIFHIGFQVSTKPIPILEIEDNSKEDKSEYSAKNMLEKYYKANGLNYKRRNDLVLFQKVEPDKQNILAAGGLSINNALGKGKGYEEYLNNEKKDIILLEKSIDKKVSYGIMQTFEKQYTELDMFTIGINNYVNNLSSIIKAFSKTGKK